MSRKTKTNKKLIIILLVALLLALSLGYAAFSDTLTISGTANAKGTFDLEFQNSEIVSDTTVGVDLANTSAIISDDKNTLTVNVADLAYPGAGAEFSVDIVNVGTIPAMVKAVTPVNLEASKNIKIKGLDSIKTDHPVIEADGRCNIHFTVEWDKNATEQIESENVSFGLEIQYTQKTDDLFTGRPAHSDTSADGNVTVHPLPKDDPFYTVPTGLTAYVGQTLGEITLPSGFSWQDPTSTLVGNVGTNNFKVTYTPEDTDNYNIITDIEVSIKVGKLTPEYEVPTGLTAKVGQTLADVALPSGFSWQDPTSTSVGSAGINRFKVVYTPTDTDKYNTVRDIQVSIGVEKLDPTYTIPTGLTAEVGQTLANVTLPSGFSWQDATSTSVGSVGTNKFKVTYTPTDTAKYNVIRDIEVSIEVTGPQKLTEVITGADYGKKINYSVTVNGKTYSDWKVLYNDGTRIQIIMSDFLPQAEVPSGTGLQKVSGKTYNVNGTSQSNLISCLKTGWGDFAKGTGGESAVGGTTKEIMEASYQGKYGTSWNTSTAQADSLYVSHNAVYQDCYGYWLASPNSSNGVFDVHYSGNLHSNYCNYANVGVRPVVSLKSDVSGMVGSTVEMQ